MSDLFQADMGAETDCSTDVGGGKNEDTMDADDFAFDMGISCVICRSVRIELGLFSNILLTSKI